MPSATAFTDTRGRTSPPPTGDLARSPARPRPAAVDEAEARRMIGVLRRALERLPE
jgi:hypothetical protein